MSLIDKQYTKTPFYGSRRMVYCLNQLGHQVNRKRVQRLMRIMGIEAIYPKKKTSTKGEGHKIYPYLLKDLSIFKSNQVWCSDITYIPLKGGFVYLVAVMDWYSRYVHSWKVSNTMDTSFCLEALQESLEQVQPEIFNTAQGSQFTSKEFTGRLRDSDIKISMDGKGRCFDNIFIERLWRSVKYEDIYIRDYLTPKEVTKGLDHYFNFYNTERPHQALDNETPEVFHYLNL